MLVSLARFVMSGPWQGPLLAAAFFIHPWTSWLSLSIIGLIGLRQGVFGAGLAGLAALMTQLIPGMLFQLIDVIAALVVIVSVNVLRVTVRLDWALLTLTLAAFVGLMLTSLLASGVFDPIIENYRLFYEAFEAQLSESVVTAWQDQNLVHLAMESVAWAVAFKACLALFLARWWQSKLYNPGGFKKEFLSLQFVPPVVIALLLGYLSLIFFVKDWAPLAQLIRVPLFLAGLAVVVWWFVERQINTGWRLAFFVSLPVTHPLVVIVGMFDSFLNLRKKLAVN